MHPTAVSVEGLVMIDSVFVCATVCHGLQFNNAMVNTVMHRYETLCRPTRTANPVIRVGQLTETEFAQAIHMMLVWRFASFI